MEADDLGRPWWTIVACLIRKKLPYRRRWVDRWTNWERRPESCKSRPVFNAQTRLSRGPGSPLPHWPFFAVWDVQNSHRFLSPSPVSFYLPSSHPSLFFLSGWPGLARPSSQHNKKMRSSAVQQSGFSNEDLPGGPAQLIGNWKTRLGKQSKDSGNPGRVEEVGLFLPVLLFLLFPIVRRQGGPRAPLDQSPSNAYPYRIVWAGIVSLCPAICCELLRSGRKSPRETNNSALFSK